MTKSFVYTGILVAGIFCTSPYYSTQAIAAEKEHSDKHEHGEKEHSDKQEDDQHVHSEKQENQENEQNNQNNSQNQSEAEQQKKLRQDPLRPKHH